MFQKIVIDKFIQSHNEGNIVILDELYRKYSSYFHDSDIQENILRINEEKYQEGFLRELFVNTLGYTIEPNPNYNLKREQKNEQDSKKADGAIVIDGDVVAVIELKDHKTPNLKDIDTQAFNYKAGHKKCVYVITSNFEKLRFYIDNKTEYEEFNLFTLTKEEFIRLHLLLSYDSISNNIPQRIKQESLSEEDSITKKLYKDYSIFKRELFADITKNNTQYDELTLFKKSQKLLDRLLFIFFAEDKGLLPPNTIVSHINSWRVLMKDPLNPRQELYDRFKIYFNMLNVGNKELNIFAYNGGLFASDEILDNIRISNDLLAKHTERMAKYDFATEVDVNILGHIFENSLTEIEEITSEITTGVKPVSKRKKDGVFYTPRYVTKYIVENTIGRLCNEKRAELNIKEEECNSDKKRKKATVDKLIKRLDDYREWLLSLTICDPACGSGAFLNAALDFLIAEHSQIDEMTAKVYGGGMVFPDIENSILENNLFGVDINDESVEIAKLSLWLRTARPHRKLNSLSNNIKCGNSLISDPEVAGDKAFDWSVEFPQVFERGGFDVVIGNPPYGAKVTPKEIMYFSQIYQTFEYQVNTYVLFYEQGLCLTKESGVTGYITPATFTYQHYFKKIRAFMQQYDQISICKYLYEVFDDADIGDCVSWIIRKQSNTHSKIKILICNQISEINDEHIVEEYNSVISDRGEYILGRGCIDISKLYINSEPLTSICNVIVGIKPYQTNKGVPKQTKETVKDKIFTANTKIDNSYVQCVIGKDFNRYNFVNEPSMFLSYGKWLAEPRESAPFFDDEKIIIRQTADTIIATIDNKKRINLNNVYNVGLRNSGYSIKYILGILNSKLMHYLYQIISQESGRLFAEVKKVYLERIPIVNNDNQQCISKKVEHMLELNAELTAKRQKFLKRVADNFDGIKITGVLERFDMCEFKEFVAQLKKQKYVLTLLQQDEWEEYFDNYKSKCTTLRNDIATTDRTIDQMVYALYNLTDDEIKIIEG